MLKVPARIRDAPPCKVWRLTDSFHMSDQQRNPCSGSRQARQGWAKVKGGGAQSVKWQVCRVTTTQLGFQDTCLAFGYVADFSLSLSFPPSLAGGVGRSWRGGYGLRHAESKEEPE